jgi:hypothetical protein
MDFGAQFNIFRKGLPDVSMNDVSSSPIVPSPSPGMSAEVSASARGSVLQSIMASFPKLDFLVEPTDETKKAVVFSTVELEWQETGPSPNQMMIPLKKKPFKSNCQTCIFQPFLSFTETEAVTRGLNAFVRNVQIGPPLPFRKAPERSDETPKQ